MPDFERRGLDAGGFGKTVGGGKPRQNYNDVLQKLLGNLKEELSEAPVLQQLRKEEQEEGEKTESFTKVWKAFTRKLAQSSSKDIESYLQGNSIDSDLRKVYHDRGERGLEDRIKYAFYGHVTGSRFTKSDIKNQKTLADLRYPTEWFPATRSMHRTIHLHVGPTNSGKTYHALKRLEAVDRGVYAGPLRLLAHEVYSRMNAKGKSCSLITGEERRAAEKKQGLSEAGGPPSDMSACTVEMMPMNKQLEVAVIDEIQMIGNAERGWAWTQALLGVRAKEVHLCGEARTVPLIQEICASVGEKVEVHRYERLSPLKLAAGSMDGDLSKLRKGDCIVSFSVMGIHALRRQIERQTGRKVATVYGSLPPETRAQQARLFNDPHNDYDFLVASDAVGMGLNLAIKRIIFEASSKFDGFQRRTLGVADIKQIAGRAGRYRTAEQATHTPDEQQDLAAAKGDSPVETMTSAGKVAGDKENVGIVTTLEQFDFPVVVAAMGAEPDPIRTAGLFPPSSVLERFASYFPPGTPFSYILTRLHELSQMHSRFHLCGLKEQIWLADLIEPVKGLTVSDRNVICSAPASKNDEMWKTLMPAYARCIAEQSIGNIVDFEELPLEVLEAEVSPSREYLRELERLHKGIVAYLWLSYRFAGIFTTRALAFHIKTMVEEKIEHVLSQYSFSETVRRKMAEARQKQLMQDMMATATREEAVEGLAAGARTTAGVEGEESKTEHGDGASENTPPIDADLKKQTMLTSGGDRFGGEEDLSWEEPVEVEEVTQGETPASVSFAAWRAQQTRGESQGSYEPEHDEVDNPISEAFRIQEENVGAAAQEGSLLETGAERPAVADVVSEGAAGLSNGSEMASLEQNDDILDRIVTPETELQSDHSALETQAEPPSASPEESAVEPSKPQPGERRFDGGVPPKHLAAYHVEVKGVEVDRDAGARP
ncbi:hypothetical protein B0A50_00552 [Salinomyces thailandicus]|uniref:RNA helicase n=1 Tax=Salinomyces thailandicus TaxID=706561 RepID=A0A4U0UGD0_9PEZI|nr:hypothetical protein B0A50_00552 [Salinomyces thailandica]